MFSLGMHFGFGFMTAVIIINLIDDVWEWFSQHRKSKKKTMNRRFYFISYIGINSAGGWAVGHCTIDTTNASLSVLAEHIQKESDFKNPATIITLKDLTEEEYDMLNGEQNGN